MKKILSKILSAILYSFFILLVFVVLNGIYCTVNKKVPSFFGYSFLRIVTDSMAPTIKSGDYIITKKVPKSELKVSDIITFYSSDPLLGGAPNTHRIAEIKGDQIITKGDANPNADRYAVSYDKVIGRYQGKLSIKFLGEIFKNKGLFFVVFILPLIAFIILESVEIIKLKLNNGGRKKE
ncbi:MAG: signal peptidase I [Acutalibacteraceae bacterium]|jgi:signal peptidase